MSFTTVFRPRTRTSSPTPRPAGAAPRSGLRTTLHLKTDSAMTSVSATDTALSDGKHAV